jgi:PIN domain nuclease of toxin-antitoxin system
LKVLLDTQVLLWFAIADPQLSGPAMTLIMDQAYEKVVSPASYWEIAIKISIGKYALSQPYEVFMDAAIDQNGFGYLHIEPKHTAALITLPFHHKDPFDRLLAAQALVEGILVVSTDTIFDQYGIKRIWE